MRRRAWLWGGALALLGLGVALVFGAVLAPGLFIPGVVLIDLGMVLVGAAAALRVVRGPEPA